MPASASFKIEVASVQAFVVYFSHSDTQISKRMAGELATNLLAQQSDWLLEVTPSFSSVVISYDLHNADYYRAKQLIKQQCEMLLLNQVMINQAALNQTAAHGHQQAEPNNKSENKSTKATTHIIDVCYEHPDALDIEHIAQNANLTIDELINLHSNLTLSVDAIGFAPGFAYLTGLPPVLQLPRRSTPRLKVPAGAVAIAQQQTAIYPEESPGGWHIIGLSPAALFDAHTPPYSLFKVGDNVTFNAISFDEYQRKIIDKKTVSSCL